MTCVEIRSMDEPTAVPMRAYLGKPPGQRKARAIIVAHELFGVTADIRGVVDRLAELGYVALAPEFYHRTAPAGEALSRDEAGRQRGFEHLNRVSRDDVVGDVDSAIEYLEGRDDVKGPVGMLGFSAGGHMAFLAAARLRLAATAVVYGGWLTGGDLPLAKPDATITHARGIAEQHGKLLYLVGERDALIPKEQVARIRAELALASVDHEVVAYPDAAHAFFWEDTPAFHRGARDDAWQRIERFFAQALPAS